MAADLPDFRTPPLTEVVLGVQFRALPITGVALGAYWRQIREHFPNVEEQPPLPPIFEDFGPPKPPQFNIQLFGEVPSPRYWFISDDRSRLLQIQKDRLMFNWRRGDDAAKIYPHYEAVREDFDRAYAAFTAFVASELETSVDVTWLEATYINLIRVPGAKFADLSRVVTLVPESTLEFLHAPDDTSVLWRFLIPDEEGAPLGRLTVSAQSGFSPADLTEPLINLTLTARGRASKDQPLEFLDIAREWIVRGFTDLTTAEMHEQWGRFQ